MKTRLLMATLPPSRPDISTPPAGVLTTEPESSTRPTSPGPRPASASLEDLLRTCRLAPHDVNVLEELARRFEPLIRRLCFGCDRGSADLDDLLQEARIAFIKAARRFDERKSRSFALFARRRILWAIQGFVRTHARARTLHSIGCPNPERADSLQTVLMRATGLLRIDLTPTQRRVLHSLFVEGLSVRECAAELGLAPARVRKVKSRALARVRRALGMPRKPAESLRNVSQK